MKKLSLDLSHQLRGLGLKCDPIVKSYHLTLAYQFQQNHFQGQILGNAYFWIKLKIGDSQSIEQSYSSCSSYPVHSNDKLLSTDFVS